MLAVCARRVRDLVLMAGLGLAAAQAAAATDTSALAVSSDLHALIAETTLVTADQEPDLHADRAKTVLERLRVSVPAALAAVVKDPGQKSELEAQWADLLTAYEGTPFAVAFRENSYDTNLTARYSAGSGSILLALEPAAAAQAAKSPVAQVRLRAMKTLSSYLQLSTGIVGGTSFSANDEENDIPSGVAAVDKGLAALKKQYAGKPEAATLQRAISRWQFLRPTLLKSSGQSTPFIVYTHGQAVVQALAQLEGR